MIFEGSREIILGEEQQRARLDPVHCFVFGFVVTGLRSLRTPLPFLYSDQPIEVDPPIHCHSFTLTAHLGYQSDFM